MPKGNDWWCELMGAERNMPIVFVLGDPIIFTNVLGKTCFDPNATFTLL